MRDAQWGDDTAREKLILCNLRLVRSVVLKYENLEFNVSADDLMGDGIIGLCKAIAKYDESFGTRLSTYAVLWIYHLHHDKEWYHDNKELRDYIHAHAEVYY